MNRSSRHKIYSYQISDDTVVKDLSTRRRSVSQ